MSQPPKPTPSELKILKHLWQQGPSTVRAVHEAIGVDAGHSYTTTLKQMQIMHGKGLLRRDDSQRAHVFQPACGEESTQRAMLDDFMNRVYEGSASQLVLQALGTSKPASADELAEIERLVQRLRHETGGGDRT
ncbi:BlaI/MecI/CopY family transcriptional regulator [Wenzhouxiangella sp. EGI_FJ10409]|uniref:BlaI/MecI/CopY family transcriptional regulator n=1 Tax=Wenzhouxiangella sp. EGI_FJ10409 TaxID=3243767 RepID=UPI0035DC239B